jgi:hypothetical protein
MQHLKPLIALALLCAIATTDAQTPISAASDPSVVAPQTHVTIYDLSWMDQSKMEQEIIALSELTTNKIGTPIRIDLGDLDTLQTLINKKIVAQDDYKTQQAMGLVLGNLILADFPETFEWKIYADELGRSRALCVKKTRHCLFPITMLSRRMEMGTTLDVKKVHRDAITLMEKYLPKMPYGGGIMYKLPGH